MPPPGKGTCGVFTSFSAAALSFFFSSFFYAISSAVALFFSKLLSFVSSGLLVTPSGESISGTFTLWLYFMVIGLNSI
jgi:hypothetical protein